MVRRKKRSERMYRALCYVYGELCLKCGAVGELHIDHVVPHSKGGADEFKNYQLLCVPCNRSKAATTADYRPRLILAHGSKGEPLRPYDAYWAGKHQELFSDHCDLIHVAAATETRLKLQVDSLKNEVLRLQKIVEHAQQERASMARTSASADANREERKRNPWFAWWPLGLPGVPA